MLQQKESKKEEENRPHSRNNKNKDRIKNIDTALVYFILIILFKKRLRSIYALEAVQREYTQSGK